MERPMRKQFKNPDIDKYYKDNYSVLTGSDIKIIIAIEEQDYSYSDGDLLCTLIQESFESVSNKILPAYQIFDFKDTIIPGITVRLENVQVTYDTHNLNIVYGYINIDNEQIKRLIKEDPEFDLDLSGVSYLITGNGIKCTDLYFINRIKILTDIII